MTIIIECVQESKKHSAYEDMFLYDAPNAHVVAYYDHKRLERIEHEARARFFTIRKAS